MNMPKPLCSVGLLTTYQCNLDCTYCYIPHKQARQMELKTAQGILRPLLEEPGDPLVVTLMGAELLMAMDLVRELVEWVEGGQWQRQCMFFGSTNGTLLTPERKEWFYAHRKSITLGLSYDGTPSAQEHNRGMSANHIDLDFFLKTWPKQKVQMTISEESVASMAEGVIYLLEKGFAVNANAAYEARNWSGKSLREYCRQLRILGDYYLEHPEAALIYQFVHSLDEYARNLQNHPEQRQMCGAGDGFWVFDVDGQFYPCHILSPLVLNQEQLAGLKEWEQEQQKGFADPRCRKCPFVTDCPTCMGCNYLYRGSFRRRDLTHCWLMAAEVRATMRLEVRRLKKKTALTPEDARLIQSIRALKNFFSQATP